MAADVGAMANSVDGIGSGSGATADALGIFQVNAPSTLFVTRQWPFLFLTSNTWP
jgi:hypothetical protein